MRNTGVANELLVEAVSVNATVRLAGLALPGQQHYTIYATQVRPRRAGVGKTATSAEAISAVSYHRVIVVIPMSLTAPSWRRANALIA